MNKIASYIIKAKYAVIVVTLLITGVLGYYMKDLNVNPDVLSYLPDDDPEAVTFREIGKTFGGNQTGLVAMESKDIFSITELEHIVTITDSLKSIDGITTVISLADVVDIKDYEGIIEIGKLVDEYNLPTTDEELDSLKRYTLSKEMYKGTLISEDADMTLIAFKMEEGVDKMKIAEEVKQKIKSLNFPEKIYFGGLPFMLLDVGEIIMNDILFLAPLALLVIIIVLFFSFKSIRGVVLPVITVSIAIVWTLGIMGFLEYDITLISNVTPVILLAVGSAYTIHVFNRITETRHENYQEKVRTGLVSIIVPVFLASLTTIVGFVSFVFGSYLTMISSFGMFTALGVFFSLLLSITFAPALLACFKNSKDQSKEKENKLIRKFLTDINSLVFKKPKVIFAFWGILIVVSIVGINMIERKVDLLDYFKENFDAKISENILREKFGGTLPIYITVKGDVQSPELLQFLEKTCNFLDEQKEVANTQSVSTLISEMNNIMGEGKQVPDDQDKIYNLWFLLDGQEIMTQLVNADLDSALIQGMATTSDTKVLNNLIDNTNEFFKENGGEQFSARLTGFPTIYKKLDESLINSQFQSLIIALLFVLIVISVLLKSFPKGILATIPIVVTLIVLFGVMGLFNIPLDVATVLVGSVSIGIGIDYAIHMISSYNNEMKRENNFMGALENAIKTSGKSILINVLSVTLGFIVLLLSDLVPLQRFGALVSVTMVTSGMATLTLLPAIIIISNKKKIKTHKN